MQDNGHAIPSKPNPALVTRDMLAALTLIERSCKEARESMVLAEGIKSTMGHNRIVLNANQPSGDEVKRQQVSGLRNNMVQHMTEVLWQTERLKAACLAMGWIKMEPNGG